MFNLLDNFRFIANDGSGDTTVTPVNTGLKFLWERQDDGRFYRRKLSTALAFTGADYDYFKALYDAGGCSRVTLTIEVFCDNAWSEYFTGRIVPSQGKYDLDKCEAEFPVFTDDLYECVNQNIKKTSNWLSYGTAQTLTFLYGTIETDVCSYSGVEFAPNVQFYFLRDCWSGGTLDYQFDTDPDPAEAWRPTSHSQVHNTGANTLAINTTWKRETTTSVGTPPGNGWINTSGTTWVRPVQYNSFVETITTTTRSFEAVLTSTSDDISNGRTLSDLLAEAVDAMGCDITGVISDFFGINPQGDAPSNTAYDYAADNLQDVLIFQKSDIVNADATNDATRLDMSLFDFVEAVMNSMNLGWSLFVDGADTYFRIEHITFYEGANGLNLVTTANGKYIAGLNRFETESGIPTFEQFAYQESFNSEFLQKRIDYSSDCATESEIDRTQKLMCADLGGLLNNSAAGLTGFVFVAAYDLGGGEYLANTLGGVTNGAMAWKNLINNLWVFGRYSDTAVSTAGGTFTIESIKKMKSQAPIQIPFSCADTFDPAELVNTALGWGEVKRAEWDTEEGILTLNLLQE